VSGTPARNKGSAYGAALIVFFVVAMVGGFVVAAFTSNTSNPASSTSTSKVSASARREAAALRDLRHCGPVILNQHGNCPFALAVRQTYEGAPASSVDVRSPLSDRTYVMHCKQTRGVVGCNGADSVQVAFPGLPPR
jgi:hypothetical protein